jgi:hypothetical protein
MKNGDNREGKKMLTIPRSSDPPRCDHQPSALLLLIRGLDPNRGVEEIPLTSDPEKQVLPDFSRDDGWPIKLLTKQCGAAAVNGRAVPGPVFIVTLSNPGRVEGGTWSTGPMVAWHDNVRRDSRPRSRRRPAFSCGYPAARKG